MSHSNKKRKRSKKDKKRDKKEKYDAYDSEEETIPFTVFLNQMFGESIVVSPQDIYKKRINDSKMSTELKNLLLNRLKSSSLDKNQKEWYDKILNIPFGEYANIPIQKENVGEYFIKLLKTLDDAVYGLQPVKEEIMNFVAQSFTTDKPAPRILALHGGAGIGKTTIIREGICKALNRPMSTFSMGGIKNSHQFVGFEHTYSNSNHGSIIQSLIDSKVMNPVIFFDELDKISSTNEGEEIENLLVHITDPSQNHDFKDKYFDGISIDLSRVIFIFAFNDINNISPILKDRLHIIKINPPSNSEKIIIAKKYIIDQVIKNIGIVRDDFILTDDNIEYIIRSYSKKNSVRELKRCLETIFMKINTIKLLGKSIDTLKLSFSLKNYSLPITLDKEVIDIFLKSCTSDDDLPESAQLMFI